jgi:hypothetical protein
VSGAGRLDAVAEKREEGMQVVGEKLSVGK